jgi:hypothetical protein
MRRASASVLSACLAGPVQRKYPDMKPAGRFDLYLICISRTRHRERRLVVLFGLPPPGSTQVLTQKPRHPAGRASRIYAAGAMRAAPDPAATVIHIPLSFDENGELGLFSPAYPWGAVGVALIGDSAGVAPVGDSPARSTTKAIQVAATNWTAWPASPC